MGGVLIYAHTQHGLLLAYTMLHTIELKRSLSIEHTSWQRKVPLPGCVLKYNVTTRRCVHQTCKE